MEDIESLQKPFTGNQAEQKVVYCKIKILYLYL